VKVAVVAPYDAAVTTSACPAVPTASSAGFGEAGMTDVAPGVDVVGVAVDDAGGVDGVGCSSTAVVPVGTVVVGLDVDGAGREAPPAGSMTARSTGGGDDDPHPASAPAATASATMRVMTRTSAL
jgi:hypothetical protein